MGKRFQSVDRLARLIDPGATFGALADVGTQGGNAESDVAIHEQIDFVWQKMSIYHTSTSAGPYGDREQAVSAIFQAGDSRHGAFSSGSSDPL